MAETFEDAVKFFHDQAGWSYDPKKETPEQGKARTARALAQAEATGYALHWKVDWEDDPEPWDGDVPYDGPLWIATLYNEEGEILGSLGSIACDSPESDYGRVVNAELALEALAEIGAMKEFEILWYGGGMSNAPNRVIARDRVKRPDERAAIVTACRMLIDGKGRHDGLARGFYVREVEDKA